MKPRPQRAIFNLVKKSIEASSPPMALRPVLLILIDALLLVAVLFVAPFAWILRDGLGPDAVATHGVNAVAKAFTTFGVGPAILLLSIIRVLLGDGKGSPRQERRGFVGVIRPVLVAIVVSMLTVVCVGLLMD